MVAKHETDADATRTPDGSERRGHGGGPGGSVCRGISRGPAHTAAAFDQWCIERMSNAPRGGSVDRRWRSPNVISG